MAVAEQSLTTTESLRARVPKDVYKTLSEMAQRRSKSLSETVAELLTKALLSEDSGDTAIERAFLRALARAGDPSEVVQLQETAVFRGQTTLDLILGHVRYGVQNGMIYSV